MRAKVTGGATPGTIRPDNRDERHGGPAVSARRAGMGIPCAYTIRNTFFVAPAINRVRNTMNNAAFIVPV